MYLWGGSPGSLYLLGYLGAHAVEGLTSGNASCLQVTGGTSGAVFALNLTA